MATNTNLKAALTFPAEVNNPITDAARTIGNGALLRLAEALEDTFKFQEELDREPDANDAARWLFGQAELFVLRHEERKARNNISPRPPFED